MRLVYRDTKIVVNFIINNFTEGGRDKGVRCYNFVWASTVNLQLLPAMLYFFDL